jgi:hypothetical protein
VFVDPNILQQFLDNVKSDIIQAQEQAGKVATGESIDSYEVTVNQVGVLTTGSLSAVDYFQFIGGGRGPGGFPPLDRILEWIDAKGFLSTNITESEKESIAYLIGRKIAERGTDNRGVDLLKDVTEKRVKAFMDSIFSDGDLYITKEVRQNFA